MERLKVKRDVNNSLGLLLKNLRENKLKMSQRRFAEAIGATQSTIYRWESGLRTPTLTLPQIKSLLKEMKAAGLDPIEDLPDVFSDQEPSN